MKRKKIVNSILLTHMSKIQISEAFHIQMWRQVWLKFCQMEDNFMLFLSSFMQLRLNEKINLVTCTYIEPFYLITNNCMAAICLPFEIYIGC